MYVYIYLIVVFALQASHFEKLNFNDEQTTDWVHKLNENFPESLEIVEVIHGFEWSTNVQYKCGKCKKLGSEDNIVTTAKV